MSFEEAKSIYKDLVDRFNGAVNRAREYGVRLEPIVSWTIEPWGSGWEIKYRLAGSDFEWSADMAGFEINLSSVEGVQTGLEASGQPEQYALELAGLGMVPAPLEPYTGEAEFVAPMETPETATTAASERTAAFPIGKREGKPVSEPTEAAGGAAASVLPWIIIALALRGFLK